MLAERLEDRRVLASWSGTLAADTTWTNAEVQQVTGNLRIPSDVTLTVEPGTIVKFQHSSVQLYVDGTLDAPGTTAEKVIFTSITDDVGGDTNGDGAASSPTPGGWAQIEVTGAATISHTEIRYGGHFYGSQIEVDGGSLQMSNSVIAHSASDGVRVLNSDPLLTSNVYSSNAGAAISMNLGSNPTITGFSGSANGINGLQIDSGTLTKDLTWDDPDVVYRPDDSITVPAGMTLSIGAGQVIKPAHVNVQLVVDGTLNIAGTASDPVVFTSYADDTHGGDTNGDGNASAPARGNWARVLMRDTSVGNSIDYAEFHYGGHFYGSMVEAENTDLSVSNSTFSNSESDGLRLEGTDAVVTDSIFRDNLSSAISMNLNSNPAINGFTASGNGINGLQVDSGTLVKDLTWDDPDIVYRPDDSITVPDGMTLAIGAGQVIKPAHVNVQLLVDGTLNIAGTASDPVVFTSYADDTYGGDTNGDADGSTPARGNWARILMRDTSVGNSIDHAEFHYGGHFYGSMVEAENTDLSVSNSTFSNSESDGLRLEGTDAVVTDSIFRDNLSSAISMNLNSNPAINGFTASGNGINGLQVDSGTLVKDLTWDDPDIVYRPDDSITVPDGMTLAIGAGQVIKPAHVNVQLLVDGTLNIAGTASDPVVFTSYADDTHGGDTNGDADASAPARGNWARVLMRDTSVGNSIDYAEFHYGGHFYGSMVEAENTDLSVSNSTFSNSETDGLRLEGTDAVVTSNVFRENASAAISMNLNSNPAINGFTASGNGINGLQVDSGTLAKDLTWDDPDIVYRPDDIITVPDGMTLSIGAGQIIKPAHVNVQLVVGGTLNIAGTASDPVVFTSYADDTHGGDTNGDADGSAPARGNWARILMRDTSVGNSIDHAEFHYGGHFYGSMVEAENTDLSVSNSTFSNSESDGLRLEGTDAVVTDSIFRDNLSSAISMNLNSNPSINGFAASGNGINGLQIDAGALGKDLNWQNADIVYRPDDTITVPAGMTLSIGPGQIIKPAHLNAGIIVDGTLSVSGTIADPVVFTSIHDDSFGGDTNGNGDTMPARGNWARIEFREGSESNSIDHADLRYGGHFYGGSVIVDNAPLSVANSLFQDSESDAVLARNGASVTLANNLLVHHANAGISAASGSQITAINNTIDGNARESSRMVPAQMSIWSTT